MSDLTNNAATFLRLASEDPEVRQALDAAITQSREAEQSVLDLSVELARRRGLDLTAADLRSELESQLGLAEIVLADEATAGPSDCKSSSGCRTPCVYCNKLQDEVIEGEFERGSDNA